MLARYQIVRGRRPPDDPLPEGVRLDTRKHTRSPFRPEPEAVSRFLAVGDGAAYARFRAEYEALLGERFAADPRPFEELAARGRVQDVFLGCNCPTSKQPNVLRCHTVLALRFRPSGSPTSTCTSRPQVEPAAVDTPVRPEAWCT